LGAQIRRVLPFLAEASPLSNFPSHEAIIFAYFLIGLIALVALVNGCVNIWDKVRQKPPAHEQFARKSEVAELRVWTTQEIAATNRNLEKIEERAGSAMKQLEDRISHDIADNRSNVDKQLGILFGKLDTFQSSFQSFTNDVMRLIGKLEGDKDKSG
jgi:hypothetical protein